MCGREDPACVYEGASAEVLPLGALEGNDVLDGVWRWRVTAHDADGTVLLFALTCRRRERWRREDVLVQHPKHCISHASVIDTCVNTALVIGMNKRWTWDLHILLQQHELDIRSIKAVKCNLIWQCSVDSPPSRDWEAHRCKSHYFANSVSFSHCWISATSADVFFHKLCTPDMLCMYIYIYVYVLIFLTQICCIYYTSIYSHQYLKYINLK